MIIGRDLMKKLGVIVDFKKNLIWDNVIVHIWRAGANQPKPALIR